MSNLAQIIMEGIDNSSYDVRNAYDFTDVATDDPAFLESATATLFTDIMEAEQQYMVADVIASATIIREARNNNTMDVQAIQEGVISDTWEKIKKAFLEFIAKVKAFFKKIIEWFKAMFMNAKDFVTKYASDLKTKANKVKGFKYTGKKYTIAAGEKKANDYVEKIDTKINGIITINPSAYDPSQMEKYMADITSKLSGDSAPDDNATEVVDNALEDAVKTSDISELVQNVKDAYCDDGASEVEIEDFSENSIDEMLNFLKSSEKTISTEEKHVKKLESTINRFVKKLDNYKKDKNATGDAATQEDNKAKWASREASILSGLLNAEKTILNASIAMKKEIASKWLTVVKKFYSYKMFAKESVDYLFGEGFAVLEGKDSDDIADDIDSGKAGKDDDDYSAGVGESAIDSILSQARRFSL